LVQAGFVDGVVKGDVLGCIIADEPPGGFAEVVAEGEAGSKRFHAYRYRPGTPRTSGKAGRMGFAVPLRDVAALGPTLRFTTADGTPLRNGTVRASDYPAEPAPDGKQYVFLHLQKTAGTSVANALRSIMPQSAFASIYPTQVWLSQQEFKSLYEYEKRAFRIAFGHLYFRSLIVSQLRAPRFMTFLREPLARIKSHYWMLRRTVSEPQLSGHSVRHSDVINSGQTDEFDNMQTRMIAGVTGANVPPGEMTTKEVGRALFNLANHFDFVGFSETADADFKRLCGLLNIEPTPLPRSNEGGNGDPQDEDFKRLDWNRITYNNRFDVALYDTLLKQRQKDPDGLPQLLSA